MEVNFPFVYRGISYNVSQFYDNFVCDECGEEFVPMQGMGMVCAQDQKHTGIKLKENRMESKAPALEEIKTLTGMTIMDALTALNKQLEPNAYRGVSYGGMSFTDIKPGYLIEALNMIFGPCGYGWTFKFHTDNVKCVEGKTEKGKLIYNATIIGFEFFYSVKMDEKKVEIGPILSTGGSSNARQEFALKGAVTNAIGNAVHRLGWQIDVYKGLRSHTKEKESESYGESSPVVSLLESASLHLNLGMEKEIASSGIDLAPAIQYQLLMSLEPSEPSSKLKDMIGDDARKAVMTTLVQLLELAGCEWSFTVEMMGKEAKEMTIGDTCNLWTALVQIAGGDKKEDVIAMFQGLNQEQDE